MTPPTPLRRRWFSFSLRTLFAVVTIFCIWFGWNVQRMRERHAMLDYIKTHPNEILLFLPVAQKPGYAPQAFHAQRPWRKLPWFWTVLGGEPVRGIAIETALYSEDDRHYIQQLFPEATVVLQQLHAPTET